MAGLIPDDRIDLIQSLLLEAGRLMEDTSFPFALALPDTVDKLEARIALLEGAAQDLTALASAARALFRQDPGEDRPSQ